MPTYTARCQDCRRVVEYVCAVVEACRPPWCPECKGATKQVILTAPKGFVKGKFEAFKSVVDGSIIRTERELRRHNDRNGVVNIQDGYDEAKVLSGDFGPKPPVSDPKDLKKDIYEACQRLEQGYKPVIGVHEDA